MRLSALENLLGFHAAEGSADIEAYDEENPMNTRVL
jgi:hypothetical protein